MENLAKFDLLAIDRFRYSQPGFIHLQESGLSLSDLNSAIEIFLYQMGPEVSNYHDDLKQTGLYDLGRYDVSRDHSMGSLNINHPELFLLDNTGERSYNFKYSDPGQNEFWYTMDIGSQEYSDYWLEALRLILLTKHGWQMVSLWIIAQYSITGRAQPVKYPDDSTWSTYHEPVRAVACYRVRKFRTEDVG